jgi:hypothetical protein
MKTKNKIIAVVLILVLIALGFFREYLFVNINVVLYNKLNGETYTVVPILSFFEGFSYNSVYACKWIFTGLFSLLFFLLQAELLKRIFAEKNIVKWLLYFYLVLILLAILAFGTGYISGNLESGYRFSRMFMGILQSPVPLMFMIPVGILKRKFDNVPQP